MATKFPAENFSGDRYHGESHRSVDMVGIGPSGKSRRDTGAVDELAPGRQEAGRPYFAWKWGSTRVPRRSITRSAASCGIPGQLTRRMT